MKNIVRTALVLLVLVGVGFSQTSVNGGSIQGTITDATGAVVPGAPITISSDETGAAKKVATDNSGVYSVGPLNPGPYTVTVTMQGFQTLTVKTVVKTGTVT